MLCCFMHVTSHECLFPLYYYVRVTSHECLFPLYYYELMSCVQYDITNSRSLYLEVTNSISHSPKIFTKDSTYLLSTLLQSSILSISFSLNTNNIHKRFVNTLICQSSLKFHYIYLSFFFFKFLFPKESKKLSTI